MQALDPGDPRTVGPCRLLARIGAGGMAVVYLGQTVSGRLVAVKVMHRGLADVPAHRERFRREVAAARAVGGGYAPALADADPDAAVPWLATEFLPSMSLREAVARFGPLPTGAVWALAAGLVAALSAVHAADLVHLDVKPSNVLLAADGPRLIDFGIAHSAPGPATSPGTGAPVDAEPGGPDAGAAGTPGFMAPEQEAGRPVGPPADVHALGATLGYAAVGSPPPTDPTVWLPRIGDEALRAVVASCLVDDPAARPPLAALSGYVADVLRHRPAPAAGWWPPEVVTEIHRRATEAQNPPPPAPAPRRTVGRRVLLVGGIAGLVAVAGGVGVGIAAGGPDDAVPAPTRTPGPRPTSPSPSPTPPPRTLEFQFSGDVTLLWVTYTVNGKTTTVRNRKPPWQVRVDVPAAPTTSTWKLRFRFSPGEVSYRVLVDGFQIRSGVAGSNNPYTDQDSGSI
ncbi:MAG TPA: serine/threonine-protein kinase [Actinocatenispora sp.]